MKLFGHITVVLLFVGLSFVLGPVEATARGGGGGRGGGAGRAGGGGVGGAGARPAAAPSPAMNRSPSMSRAATPPATNAGAARTSQGQRSATAAAPKASASSASSQVPSGGQSRTYTTQRGTQITVGGKGDTTTTGSGAQVGGATGGFKVETAGGNTYGKAGAAVGASGSAGAAVAGGSVAGYRGVGGTEGAKVSRGYADSSGYRQGGSVSAAKDRQGYTAVNVRGGAGAGGTGRAGSATAVVGPGGNVVSGGRGASFVNGQFVGGQAWRGVNGAFNHWNWYGGSWWGRYPGAWFPGKWALASTAWATATWALAGPYCGSSGSPVYYDYGGNVTYDDGTVYSDGQPVGSAEEYYNQANEIAADGQSPQNEEWLPLGIFAILVSEEQTQTDKVVQLALNKEGAIRGNYHDLMADKVTPVAGAIDKETQRAAIKIEGSDSVVVETGLYNLTNDEVPVLVHFGPDRQEARTLIRLQQPELEEANK